MQIQAMVGGHSRLLAEPGPTKVKGKRRKNSRRDHMTKVPSQGYLETQAYLAQQGEWS